MEGLSLENILSEAEVESLFSTSTQETPPEEKGETPAKETEEKKEETTEVDPEDLFGEPESVGSEEKEEKEDTDPDKGSTSPKNFYSSIANALAEEGIFPDLDEQTLSKIESPEDFRDLIDQQIKAGLDEKQKRIDEALNAGVEVTEVKKYENTLSYLDSLKDSDIKEEGEKGENLRKNLIYQDFLNRGYSKERATREVEKSFRSGTDIEDAKEALASNKEFFQEQYDNLVEEAKKQEEEAVKERKKQSEALRTSILEDKGVFGDFEVDKNTRKRIYDNITKPVFRHPETGDPMTAIQKYEMEHGTDFLKYVGFIFTLTDGFKNMDGLVKGKVRKEVKKGLRELENTINNTSRNFDGGLRWGNGSDDPESKLTKWDIDI